MVNTVMLQEDISRGQRVEAFTVEAHVNGEWKVIAKGTTIGYKRLLRFPDVEADAIRVTIDECRSAANISRVGAFLAPRIK